MSNLSNNQFNNLRFEINEGEYWDFFINREPISIYSGSFNGKNLYDKCLISFIDASDTMCFDGNDIVSKKDYMWAESTVVPYALTNVGYTGVDNGLIPFKRDEVSNNEFIRIYCHSTYDIHEDKRLRLHPIDGGTKLYEYPLSIYDSKIRCNGGFYQGFFMTECDRYRILPNALGNGDVWHFEFVLNKTEFEKESEKTLNDKHPQNKGIFFYIGTRAENKWIYLYDWDKSLEGGYNEECFKNPNPEWEDTPLISDEEYYNVDDWYDYTPYIDEKQGNKCILNEVFDLVDDTMMVNPYDYIEQELKLSDFNFETSDGFVIGRNVQTYLDTDNKFLMFDRTCDGYNTENYKEGDIVRYVTDKNDFKGNLFLLMDRTCNGYTTETIDDLRDDFKSEYDMVADIVQNALAFRITDDGRIGYRYLVSDCDSDNGYKIIEGYSKENIIKEKTWHVVNVRMRGFLSTMTLEFYVDGRLVFLTKEMPKLNLRKLNEIDEKQETVAYNISLGGGTQGLCETILPNYMQNPSRVYPIEENFAGSFIGFIEKFRFYNCNMNFNDILNNYKFEMLDN